MNHSLLLHYGMEYFPQDAAGPRCFSFSQLSTNEELLLLITVFNFRLLRGLFTTISLSIVESTISGILWVTVGPSLSGLVLLAVGSRADATSLVVLSLSWFSVVSSFAAVSCFTLFSFISSLIFLR